MNFQPLLRPQSSVKVVLNGGHRELDDATIPFTIGMSDDVANQEPTHVLMIDISDKDYEEYHYVNEEDLLDIVVENKLDFKGYRSLYELSKISFIQFHRPGNHNLIFILLRNPSHKVMTRILKRRSLAHDYQYGICLQDVVRDSIEDLKVIGYCETLVEIPEHFFAMVPQKGIKQIWWKWVNRWPRYEPIDQCDFRKRAIIALTIQPIAWVLGFMLRLVYSLIFTPILLLFKFVALLFGVQMVDQFKKLGRLWWDFLFLYRKMDWAEALSYRSHWFDEEDTLDYKVWKVGKKKVKICVTPVALLFQLFCWGTYFHGLYDYWHGGSPGWSLLITSLGASYLGFWDLLIIADTGPDRFKKWMAAKIGMQLTDDEKVAKPGHLRYLLFAVVSIVCFLLTNIPWYAVLHVLMNLWFWAIVFTGLALMFTVWKKAGKWLMSKFPIPKALLATPEGLLVVDLQKQKKTRSWWLRNHMSLDQLPEKVSLRDISAPTKTGFIAQVFKVSFWSTKAKVCKPYAK